MTIFLDPRLPQRFWDKVQPCPMTGCWLWVGAATNSASARITHAKAIAKVTA